MLLLFFKLNHLCLSWPVIHTLPYLPHTLGWKHVHVTHIGSTWPYRQPGGHRCLLPRLWILLPLRTHGCYLPQTTRCSSSLSAWDHCQLLFPTSSFLTQSCLTQVFPVIHDDVFQRRQVMSSSPGVGQDWPKPVLLKLFGPLVTVRNSSYITA